MRVVGIDLGDKRVGVAVSDSERTVAVPVDVFVRGGNQHQDMKRLAKVIHEHEPKIVVVGTPLLLSGGSSKQTLRVNSEAKMLSKLLDAEVQLWDERYSSRQAERQLREIGHSSKSMRKIADAQAACIILQSWIDANVTRSADESNGQRL